MQVEDELAIHRLVSTYADAVNRRDGDAWSATWAVDGLWALAGNEVRGRDTIRQFWDGAMANFPNVVQLVYNGVVEETATGARGRWYLAEHLKFADGNGMFNLGCYHDVYVREDGAWKFAERHYTVLYNDEGKGDMTGVAQAVPAPPWG